MCRAPTGLYCSLGKHSVSGLFPQPRLAPSLPKAALGVTACVPSLTWNQRGKVEGLKLENRALGDRSKGGEKRTLLGRGKEETQMLATWEGALHALVQLVCLCACASAWAALSPPGRTGPTAQSKPQKQKEEAGRDKREDRGGWGVGAGGEASEGKPAAVAALSINSPEELALRTYSSRTVSQAPAAQHIWVRAGCGELPALVPLTRPSHHHLVSDALPVSYATRRPPLAGCCGCSPAQRARSQWAPPDSPGPARPVQLHLCAAGA